MEARSDGGEGTGPRGRLLGEEPLGDQLGHLRPRMTSVALRFAANRAVAEDIVQNAYEKAVKNLHQFGGRSRLSTWLHRIVVNEALMWLRSEERRRRRHLQLDDSDAHDWIDPTPDASQRLSTHERAHRIREGVASLPAPEREVIQACALGGKSYEQFCAEAGIQVAAAKSRAFRGRRRLRELLADA